MPARTRRRIGFALTEMQQEMLLDGGENPFAAVTLENTFGTMEAAKEAWNRHRQRLMRAYPGPGRPWGWWAFEAPPWGHLLTKQPEKPAKGLKILEHPDPIMPGDQLAVLRGLGLLDR